MDSQLPVRGSKQEVAPPSIGTHAVLKGTAMRTQFVRERFNEVRRDNE